MGWFPVIESLVRLEQYKSELKDCSYLDHENGYPPFAIVIIYPNYRRIALTPLDISHLRILNTNTTNGNITNRGRIAPIPLKKLYTTIHNAKSSHPTPQIITIPPRPLPIYPSTPNPRLRIRIRVHLPSPPHHTLHKLTSPASTASSSAPPPPSLAPTKPSPSSIPSKSPLSSSQTAAGNPNRPASMSSPQNWIFPSPKPTSSNRTRPSPISRSTRIKRS